MKKKIFTYIIVIAVAIASYLIGATQQGKQNDTYVNCFRVAKVENNLAYLEAQNGNIFTYETDNNEEEMLVNELYAVQMNTNGTEIVYDDEITDIRYCGFLYEDEGNSWIK